MSTTYSYKVTSDDYFLALTIYNLLYKNGDSPPSYPFTYLVENTQLTVTELNLRSAPLTRCIEVRLYIYDDQKSDVILEYELDAKKLRKALNY